MRRDLGRTLRTIASGLSLSVWAVAFLCYWLRPDTFAIVTMYPAWVWFAAGSVLAIASFGRGRTRPAALAVILWLSYMAVFVEEPASMLRSGRWPSDDWAAARARGEGLRVVSLNCMGGSVLAAREAWNYDPDIVLLQESPPLQQLRQVAAELLGERASIVSGPDTAIVARGNVSTVPLARDLSMFATHARVPTASGVEAEVIAIRLLPPTLCLDLLSVSCWQAQLANRQARRAQAQLLAAHLASVPPGSPLILGGDFNAPAGDGAFRPLRPRLRDAFAAAGVGWGNTATNDLPLIRVDQIWVSPQWRVAATVARQTQHSDHRVVISDLILSGPRRPARPPVRAAARAGGKAPPPALIHAPRPTRDALWLLR